MATVTRFVDAASTAGGNGTTDSIVATDANRAYVSINEWNTQEADDISTGTGSDTQHVVNCGGTTAQTVGDAQLTGWTTDVTGFFTINGNNTSGAYNTSAFRIEYTTSANYREFFNNGENYSVINDIQGILTSSDLTGRGIASASLDGASINRCIVKGVLTGTTGGATGIQMRNNNVACSVFACLCYDFDNDSGQGFSISSDTATDVLLYNNTAENCVTGFNRGYDDLTARNNLAQNCTTPFSTPGSGWTGATHNAAESGVPGTSTQTGTVSFADLGGEDYQPVAEDTVTFENGVDLSGVFTTDLAGNTFPATWSIGCLIPAAAGSDVDSIFSDRFGAAQSDLSGLSWAWFDEDVGVLNAPTAQGAVETSDSGGVSSIDVTGTALAGGATGTLVLYDSTSEKFGAYRALIDSNGSIRFTSPVSGTSFYFDTQTGTIGVTSEPPLGPLR